MSDYTKDTTTDEILEGVDLSGRRFVITGASSGLGEESTRALAAHGATVTMLARSQEKLDAAAARVRERVPEADLELGIVDLADQNSIAAFAEAYLADHPAIDVLINNAGVMACPLGRTADGYEMQFGTNHLGHFALTMHLMPALLAGDAPRVVTLSSAAHGQSDVNLDDWNYDDEASYDPWASYGRSKSANALFARELATRYGDQGLLSFAVHPGGIMTELGRHLTEELIAQMMDRSRERAEKSGEAGGGFEFKSVEAGAATQVWAATAPELADHNGHYLADCRLGELGVNVGTYGMEPWINDDATAAQLWDLSEKILS